MTGKIVLLFLCSFIGLALILYTFIQLIVAKKKYEKVKAVCVSVNCHNDDDGTTYQPVWEYYYNCQKYTSAMKLSSSFLNIPVGTEKIIYVDPHNPLKIYTFFLSSIIFQTAAGLVFFIAGIIFLLSYMSQGWLQ